MDAFLAKAKASGYDGVELWMPTSEEKKNSLKEGLKKYQLQVIFLHGTNRNLPFQEALLAYEEGLKEILSWKPMKVNSHTGNDFWTQEQNLAFIALGDRYEKQVGIPVLHETHRGRFSYTLPDALAMLRKFPNLKYTLDISHWMVVHERLLTESDPLLQEIFPAVDHIHARVGYAEGPQVPNPAAPEWENEVKVHVAIWEKIIRSYSGDVFTVTTEFGPPPYMQTVPFTKQPLADQWEANVWIMNALKSRFQ
jgi:sugar phosphate isomerase/epimerase